MTLQLHHILESNQFRQETEFYFPLTFLTIIKVANQLGNTRQSSWLALILIYFRTNQLTPPDCCHWRVASEPSGELTSTVIMATQHDKDFTFGK